MILILPFGILVQVHRNGYFLYCPKNAPVLTDSGLGQVGQSLHLTLLPPKTWRIV